MRLGLVIPKRHVALGSRTVLWYAFRPKRRFEPACFIYSNVLKYQVLPQFTSSSVLGMTKFLFYDAGLALCARFLRDVIKFLRFVGVNRVFCFS